MKRSHKIAAYSLAAFMSLGSANAVLAQTTTTTDTPATVSTSTTNTPASSTTTSTKDDRGHSFNWGWLGLLGLIGLAGLMRDNVRHRPVTGTATGRPV